MYPETEDISLVCVPKMCSLFVTDAQVFWTVYIKCKSTVFTIILPNIRTVHVFSLEAPLETHYSKFPERKLYE